MGHHAVLVEDPPGGPAAWGNGVRAQIPGVIDVVPAASTVLVRWSSAVPGDQMVDLLRSVVPAEGGADRGEVVIGVRYDGVDLAEVSAATGLSVGEAVALHRGATYEVAFCGFAPGFAYLTGLPHPLHLPRRSTPRTLVPAGSVAIAAGYSAVYPGASPGGWHVLGSTELALFDPDGDPPALLTPGTRVRFEPA